MGIKTEVSLHSMSKQSSKVNSLIT